MTTSDSGTDRPVPREVRPQTALDLTVEGRLTFPDAPRLDLDQLLEQVVERAQEVIGVQGRLRGLLKANQMIIGDLGLEPVLRRIAEAARELVGARFAALGVVGPDGSLEEFVHVGMAPGDVELIGHPPRGHGLLGALIEDPRPIRLRNIADDPRSSGFPPNHPPMSSFLGVPIRIRDEVFGNLYLSESIRGEFTAEDEELAKSLAATAAAAIDNARLYEAAQTRGEWLQASASIARQILTSDADQAFQIVVERSRQIARADLATIVLPIRGTQTLRVEAAAGAGEDALKGLVVPVSTSLAGKVLQSGEPVRIADRAEEPGLVELGSGIPDSGPVLAVPLLTTAGVRGVLVAARLKDRSPFTAADLELAGGFANQAALALELAEARAEQQRALMAQERERIAADLHDHVIQRLFAAGLSLQSVLAGLDPSRAADRVSDTIGELDDTIRQIRTTIFQLHLRGQDDRPGFRVRVLDVAGDVTSALGFEPAVRFAGLLEGSLPEEQIADLLAVLREALSNVARHARATTAEVDLRADAETLTLEVRDDGVGLGPTSRRSGLANLQRRAEKHGGRLTVEARLPRGTRLFWSIPRATNS